MIQIINNKINFFNIKKISGKFFNAFLKKNSVKNALNCIFLSNFYIF